MRIQQAIHWLEQGRGARWLGGLAVGLAVVAFSGLIAFKQFRGPGSEETLIQAETGRALAAGEGFTTGVRYPQVAALRAGRGEPFVATERWPELHHAPLYAATIGAVIAILPDTLADRAWVAVPLPPDGYGGDYLLLALNTGLFWVALIQTWWLGRKWFDGTVGGVAAGAVLVSWPLWQHVLAVDGTALAMVVGLGWWQALTQADSEGATARSGRWLLVGGLTGLMGLVDYASFVVAPLVAGYAFWRSRRWGAVLVLGGVILVTGPWVARNVTVNGTCFGLAGEGLALRAGDPTAEPAQWRATLSGAAPELSLAKLGNKVLTGLGHASVTGGWSGGALVGAALFVTGWMYRFRRDDVNRWRGLATVVLLALVIAGAAGSGEGERKPLVWGAPWLILFGVGFARVLLAGASSAGARRLSWVAAGLLAWHALPLGQKVLEPRQPHFSFPPYYPGVFENVGREMDRRGGRRVGLMSDAPAGLAWYAGQSVWAQPAALHDFYTIQIEQPTAVLLLTPHTLHEPFFGGLNRAEATAATTRFGGWNQIYAGLVTGRFPEAFPLRQVQRVADDLIVLVDHQLLATP